ncbi:hypothetical protein PINS_up011597 [Pythium insidiosum]|nr:hypothetical protein PINS_up011597 [Pythium insidiosum]
MSSVFAAFHLLVEQPSLRPTAASITLQWMKQESVKASGTGLTPFLRVALGADASSDTDAAPSNDRPTTSVPPPTTSTAFQEEAQFVMSQFRQHLVDDITQVQLTQEANGSSTLPSRLDEMVTKLHVLLGLLLQSGMRPDEHETTQLLRCFDRIAKEVPTLASSAKFARLVSLMYIALLALCAPSAANMSKIPSQRDDTTRLVLSLSQQCVYSLYNAKTACPLLVLSAVLLFTKSPSLLPFLSSFLGDTFASSLIKWNTVSARGAMVMAREVLTTFPVVSECVDIMDEITLRCLYGLLVEKSYLRHHHSHRLEERLTEQLQHPPESNLSPLMVSILLEYVENYVMAFEYPIAQRPTLQLAIVPLRATFVSRALRAVASHQDSEHTTRAALVLLYALHFNKRMRQASAAIGSKLHTFVNQGVEDSAGANSHPPSQPASRANPDIIVSYDLRGVSFGRIIQFVTRQSGVGERFERRHRPHLLLQGGLDEQPVVSWCAATLWLTELMHWSSEELIAVTQRDLLGCLVPLAILSLSAMDSTPTSDDPEAFLAAFHGLYETRLRTEASDYADIQTQLLQALTVPHLVWERNKQQLGQVKTEPSSSLAHTHVDAVWIPRTQLIEKPFSLLQPEAQAVATKKLLASPSLLKLITRLALEARDEAIFVQRRRDSSWLRHAGPSTEANGAGGMPPTALSSTPWDMMTQQFLLVQDCLLVHALFANLQEAFKLSGGAETEIVTHVTASIEHVMERSSFNNSGPSLVLTIHLQGYDISLVKHVVSKRVGDEWKGVCRSTRKRQQQPRQRRCIKPGSKSLTDFVAEAAAERDATKWHFRLAVFFSLCDHYFVPSQSNVVLPAIKQILQRLRVLIVATSSGGGAGGLNNKNLLPAFASFRDPVSRAAFLDDVLREITTGCVRHPEIRTEVAQFLLNLKKHVTSTSSTLMTSAGTKRLGSSSNNNSSNTNTVDAPSNALPSLAPLEMDQVILRAYQRVLNHIG